MIDWPNLIAGFILGVVASLGFLIWDRRHERAKEKAEARSEWLSAASEIELVLWNQETTSTSLYSVVTRLPLERWRRLLGPDDFRALERVQGAYASIEGFAARATDDAGIRRFAQAAEELRASRIDFANLVRMSKSEEYTQLMDREERQKVRKNYRQHPIKTWKRERHNRRVRREHEAKMRESV